jgi:hypothetical protein
LKKVISPQNSATVATGPGVPKSVDASLWRAWKPAGRQAVQILLQDLKEPRDQQKKPGIARLFLCS